MELESYYMQIDISKVAYELANDMVGELFELGVIDYPYVNSTDGKIEFTEEAKRKFEELYEHYWNTIHSIAHD